MSDIKVKFSQAFQVAEKFCNANLSNDDNNLKLIVYDLTSPVYIDVPMNTFKFNPFTGEPIVRIPKSIILDIKIFYDDDQLIDSFKDEIYMYDTEEDFLKFSSIEDYVYNWLYPGSFDNNYLENYLENHELTFNIPDEVDVYIEVNNQRILTSVPIETCLLIDDIKNNLQLKYEIVEVIYE